MSLEIRIRRKYGKQEESLILSGFQILDDGQKIEPGLGTAWARAGPGRPRLGVVSREITLLPRHWDWLSKQSGGASVVLRRLVEQASKASSATDRIREAREVCYRFMTVMAGDRSNFEDATRALYAGNKDLFFSQIVDWPKDIKSHLKTLAEHAFPTTESE